MRKLATVQKIEEVLPIEGADVIEKIRVKQWWVVAKKNEFKDGDHCIYFEIDSLLPDTKEFEFLKKPLYEILINDRWTQVSKEQFNEFGRDVKRQGFQKLKKQLLEDGKEIEGHRLKTVRLRGQISQGLVLPLNAFPILVKNMSECPDVYNINDDVSEVLNVFKYEAPIPADLAGEAKGALPSCIPHTNEERIQNCAELLEKHKGKRFYITIKLDGSSNTIYRLKELYDGELGVCGHNWDFRESEKSSFWRFANKYNLKEKFPEGYAMQSECAGEGVQKNRQKIKQDLYAFYVFDIRKYQYLKLDDMKAFVKELGMKTVPILDENFIMNHTCEDILKLADQTSINGILQEGLVFRLYDSTEKISFKSISNEYLLKHGL